ncbi:hypothetical protein TSUD_343380 [Trifolium subterraneum]|nr:hypothetical protein TSUD_343380 [Trifolium subterraneum]
MSGKIIISIVSLILVVGVAIGVVVAVHKKANEATGFIARDMTFQNTAGPIGEQAVAFHNQGDRSAIVNCHFEGYQDTLYVHANRQFYRDCVISGTIDFIFGTSHTLIQNSEIILRKPGVNQTVNTITADGTGVSKDMFTGIVIQNCTIVPDKELIPVITKVKSYLGRPWKELSRTVFMESNLGDVIDPKGWTPWPDNGTEINIDRCYYAEYANTGLSANTSQRVKWKGYQGIISWDVAQNFIGNKWLKPRNGTKDQKYAKEWLTPDVPHYLGFANKPENKLNM